MFHLSNGFAVCYVILCYILNVLCSIKISIVLFIDIPIEQLHNTSFSFEQDKLEKLRQAFNRAEVEKRSLHEELSRSESRATKLELQRLGLEGDLQRLQMVLQEKDATIQVDCLKMFSGLLSIN